VKRRVTFPVRPGTEVMPEAPVQGASSERSSAVPEVLSALGGGSGQKGSRTGELTFGKALTLLISMGGRRGEHGGGKKEAEVIIEKAPLKKSV